MNLQIYIKTSVHKEILDITPQVDSFVKKSDKKEGTCNIFAVHTTCAVTTMDLDPGTDQDFLEAIEKMFPQGNWRHAHDPSHVGEHILSSIIGQSVSVPFKNSELILGTWQKIVLVELAGPRTRNIVLSL